MFDVPLIDRVLCGSSPLFVGGHLIFLTESDEEVKNLPGALSVVGTQ